MGAASRAWLRKMFGEPLKRISSPGWEFGLTHFGSPGGPTISRSGPAAVPVSLSPARAASAASTTSVTSGQPGSSSSKSAALQSSLASRLRALTAFRGSTLYRLTWKERGTPSGRQICALRGSVLRTSGSDCSSWPTPQSRDGSHGSGQASEKPSPSAGSSSVARAPDAAKLASWPTPTASDSECSDYSYRGGNPDEICLKLPGAAKLASWATPTAVELGNTLENYTAMKRNMKSGARMAITHLSIQAQLVSWATPAARDWRDGRASPETMDRNSRPLNEQAVQLVASGPTPSGSPASTGSGGQLNPNLSRWLMGVPKEWDACAPRDPSGRSPRAKSPVAAELRATETPLSAP